jgi:hypothetical protein
MSSSLPARVLFVFLDGVGVGPPDPEVNPFLRASLPTLRGLLGGSLPTLDGPEVAGPSPDGDPEAVAFPLDPLLDVEGLPQSGTGHAALLTGRNAPALFGRHFGPWVPVKLRPLVREESFLARARSRNVPCAFANAVPTGWEGSPWARRPAGPPLAAEGAGLLTRTEDELARGEALSSEIVNTPWLTRLGFTHLPEPTPRQAGANLARIAARHRLTFFAHYGTDHAGHQQTMDDAVAALERVDAFLGGLLSSLPGDTLLVLASDHGNAEDISGGHSLNPTLNLLRGVGAHRCREGLERITDLADMVLQALDGAGRGED